MEEIVWPIWTEECNIANLIVQPIWAEECNIANLLAEGVSGLEDEGWGQSTHFNDFNSIFDQLSG